MLLPFLHICVVSSISRLFPFHSSTRGHSLFSSFSAFQSTYNIQATKSGSCICRRTTNGCPIQFPARFTRHRLTGCSCIDMALPPLRVLVSLNFQHARPRSGKVFVESRHNIRPLLFEIHNLSSGSVLPQSATMVRAQGISLLFEPNDVEPKLE